MRFAVVASFTVLTFVSVSAAAAQDPAGTASGETASATEAKPASQPAPISGQPRPRRPSLMDVIKTVAPPLIDAATKPKPPPPVEPAVEPVATGAPAADPPPATPAAVAVTPSPPAEPPRPFAAEALPSPATRPPLPTPADPAVAPPRPDAPGVPTRAELPPSIEAPTPISSAEPTPASAAPAMSGELAVIPPDPPREEDRIPWLLFALLAIAIAAAGLLRLQRMRQVARTRSLLSLDARLERLPAVAPLGVPAELMSLG